MTKMIVIYSMYMCICVRRCAHYRDMGCVYVYVDVLITEIWVVYMCT